MATATMSAAAPVGVGHGLGSVRSHRAVSTAPIRVLGAKPSGSRPRAAAVLRQPRRSTAGDDGSQGLRFRTTCRTAQAPGVTTDEAEDVKGDKFVFSKQWWPVAVLCDLDPSRPNAAELLGERVVLWRDGEGAWQCFQDRCPHRLAPLSEGRLEGGNLSCAYHGWEFEGSGACTRIPQSDSPETHAKACANPRACAKSHPVQVRHGLLFAWGESGATAALEATATPVPVMRELDEPANRERLTVVADWFTSIVPYSYDTLCENVLDPSHVPFSHHGVQGNRKNGKAIPMQLEGSVTVDGGFVTSQPGGGTISFAPPGVINYRGGARVEGLSAFNMMIYAVPLRPGYSRLYFCVATTRKSPALRLLRLIPRWVQHLPRMEVLSGDGIFLHAQERELRRLAPASTWNKQFFMPNSADTAVVAFRRWYHDLAGGAVGYAPGVPPELPPLITDRRVLNDRWGQHVKDCPSCRGAHHTMGRLQVVAAVSSAVLLLLLAASLGAASASTATVPLLNWNLPASTLKHGLLAVGAALCAMSIHWLGQLRQKLVFVDYVHAERE